MKWYLKLKAKDANGVVREWRMGDRVVRRDGKPDTIRNLFKQTTLLEPYGRNIKNQPAAVLTDVSWALCSDLVLDFPVRATAKSTSKNEFKRIDTVSNWSYIDKLDGKDITDGESVEVQWPDDIITLTQLHIERGTFRYSDHGHEYDGANHRAFIWVIHHGATIRLDLRNTGIKLRRVE